MPAGAVPAGTDAFIQGQVTDSDGVGISGMTVTAYNAANSICCLGGQTATTDSAGDYSIDVSYGSWIIEITDYSSGAYLGGWYSTSGLVDGSDQATPVAVTAGNVTVNMSLVAAPRIMGDVTNASSIGLANIGVYLYGGSATLSNLEGTAETAADGSFAFETIPGGTYSVCFEDPTGTYANGCFGESGLVYINSEATLITVGSADVIVDVQLPVTVSISGLVTDTHGNPLADVNVIAYYEGQPTGSGAYTGDDGAYSITLLHPGVTTISMVRTGQPTVWYAASGPTYDSGAATAIVVGSSDLTLNLVLPDPVQLSGVVTAGGGGLSGLEVDVYRNGSYYGQTVTATGGSYSLVVVPGAYEVGYYDSTFTYASGWYSENGFTADPSKASVITITTADVTNLDVTLPASEYVLGAVTDPSGTGLASGYVEAWVDGAFYAASYTASDGSYAVPVASGSCTLWVFDLAEVYAGGWWSGSSVTSDPTKARALTIGSADVSGINIAMKSAAHISGRISGSGGGGSVDGFFVEAFAGGSSISFAFADSSGNFSIPLLPGTYTVWADDHLSPDGSSWTVYAGGWYGSSGFTTDEASTKTLSVASSATVTVNMVLPAAVYIQGTIYDRYRNYLSGIDVDVIVDGYFYVSGSGGPYSVRVAPGQSYVVYFSDPQGTYAGGYYSTNGFTPVMGSATAVAVATGDVTGIDIELPTAVHIAGNVTNAGSTGLSGVDAYACVTGSNDCYMDSTGSSGTYSIPVAPSESYTLVFFDPSGVYAGGYYGSGGYTATEASAVPVDVATADVSGINVTLPKLAAWTISLKAGATLVSPGTAVALTAQANQDVGLTPFFIVLLDANGSVIAACDDGTTCAASVSSASAAVRTYSAVIGYAGGSSPKATSGSVTVAWVTVSAASSYTAISPRRVLDTRATVKSGNPTNIGLSGKFTAGTVRKFGVAGAKYAGGGSAVAVPANAIAVTGNLTIVNETAPGVVDLGPAASATGTTSTLSFVKGDTRANNVTLALASDGSLSAVYRSTSGATTDLIFDLTGYFLAGTSGATYHSLAPGRVLDTRKTVASGNPTHIGPLNKLANRVVGTFPVAGVKALGWTSALVPSTAVAVTGNITVTDATSLGYAALGPTMTTSPSTSTVNVAKGTNVANGVTVALKSGKLQVVWCGTTGSSADVIFDVTGYFTSGAGGLSFHGISPVRVLDSSGSMGLTGPFASRTARLFVVPGVPAGSSGIAGNLTLLLPTANGWALVSPEIVASPASSTVNASSGHSEANGFDVALGSTGQVALEWAGTTGSTANLALDVTGYWK